MNEADTPAVTIGVAVDDLDQAVAGATASGGTVEMPATDNGWLVKPSCMLAVANHIEQLARPPDAHSLSPRQT